MIDDVLLHYALFLAATFAAALAAGLSGFAFGLIAAAAWLHILPPLEAASLIVAFGLLVQGIAVWKLRHALDWRRLWPFVAGAAIGVPVGVAILTFADPRHVCTGVGAFLIAYSAYSLARPALGPVKAGGVPLDTGVGFLNGVLGGLTGLAGILVVIWCSLRGWSRDVQRTVFQPAGVATFAMTALWLGVSGSVGAETTKLFLAGLPALLAGTWFGLRLYGRLDEAAFRRIMLWLLLASGGLLVLPLLRG
jgi:uncharacterized membrane protein YfcA